MPSYTFDVKGTKHTVHGNRAQINSVKALVADRDSLQRKLTQSARVRIPPKGSCDEISNQPQDISGGVSATTKDEATGLPRRHRQADGPRRSDT